MSDFSFELDMNVRYRDLDSNAHVNNAVYATYLEQARIRYLHALLGPEVFDMPFVTVNVDINYEREVHFDDEVTIRLSVTDIGTSSISMAYEIRANGLTAVTATSVIVVADDERSGSRSVPDHLREKIVDYEGRQF